MRKNYPLFKVHVDVEQALKNVREVLESGYINEGEQVTKLTQQLSEKLKSDNLLLTNSCTSAITLALKLADVQPDDDVISTSMTCVATNTPILNAGANVIWADIDPLSGLIDPASVEQKITKKTKAIIAVAWAGTPPNLGVLSLIASRHNVKLILDAAHALGANYGGLPAHNYADYTCYSFQAIKHITTGDGGALIVRDDQHFKRAKALKWFGLDRDHAKDEKGDWKGQQWDVDVVEAGYKFNMNNLSAAVGLSQIGYFDEILLSHRNNAKTYDQIFATNRSNVIPARSPDASRSGSSNWVYTMLLTGGNLSRDELLSKLNSEGIMAGVVHVPNHNYTAFKSSMTQLPGVEKFASSQFSLPCGWWLKNDDIEHIAYRVLQLTSG
jgi:dTDP-4-amino-4,6-dideoxygalactose transaminase